MKTSLGPSTGVIEFDSIAIGYRALNIVSQDTSLNIIESAYMNPGRFVLIFSGSTAAVQRSFDDAKNSLGSKMIGGAVLVNLDNSVMEAYFGLTKPILNSCFIIFESNSVSSALRIGQMATMVDGVKLLEIKSGRGSGGKSLVFATGEATNINRLASAVDSVGSPRPLYQNCEIIENPTKEFLKLFSL